MMYSKIRTALSFTVAWIYLFFSTSSFGMPDSKIVFSEKDCLETGIKAQKFNNGQILYPRYDGKNYFIDLDGWRPEGGIAEAPTKSKTQIQQIVDKAKAANQVISLTSPEEFFSGNSTQVNLSKLPLVIELTGETYENQKIIIVISSLTFSTSSTDAEIAILTESSLKTGDGIKGETLYLGAIVKLGQGGQITGALKLIAPLEIELFDLNGAAKLNISTGTGICLGCKEANGKMIKLVLAGSLDFHPSIAVAVNADGTLATGDNSVPKLQFATIIENWDDVYVNFSFPITYGIQFKSIEGLSFWNTTDITTINPPNEDEICDFAPANVAPNITLDLSSSKSPANAYKQPDASWKGLFLNNFDIGLPKAFRKPNSTAKENLRLSLDYLFFDDNGLNCLAGIRGRDGIYKMGDAFDISLTTAKVQVDKNKLVGFELGGGFRFPYQKQNDFNGYGFELGFVNVETDEQILNRVLSLRVTETSNVPSFNILGAKFKRCNSNLSTTITNWDFDNLSIGVSGVVLFGEDSDENATEIKSVLSERPNFYVDQFRISNQAPYINELSFRVYESSNCPTNEVKDVTIPAETGEICAESNLSIAGFKFSLQSVSLAGNSSTKELTGQTSINLQLGKSCTESGTAPIIQAGAFLSFKSEYAVSTEEQLSFKLKDINVSGIQVDANFASFGFCGEARLFKNQRAFGADNVSGFTGEAELRMSLTGGDGATVSSTTPKQTDVKGFEAGVDMMFLTVNKGQPDEYKAWAVDANMAFSPGIPMGPVSLNGVFGGAYKGAYANNVEGKSNGTNTGIVYNLRAGGWGFNFGLDLSVVGKVDLSAMLAAEGGRKGLRWIKGVAYAKFQLEGVEDKLNKISEQLTAPDQFASLNNAVRSVTSETATGTTTVKQEEVGKRGITLFSKANPPTISNKIAAGATVTINFGNEDEDNAPGYFQLILYPDIQISMTVSEAGASLASRGFGELYFGKKDNKTAKYLHLGRQAYNERIGLSFAAEVSEFIKINADVSAYLMLGTDIGETLPKPVIPTEFLQRFTAYAAKNNIEPRPIGNYSEVTSGSGFAAGFSIGVGVQFKAKKVIDATIRAGVGIDALLVLKDCPDGMYAGDGGSKTWRGSGQLYGFAEGRISVFGVNLAGVGLGFLLRASVPQPFYAEGELVVHANVWKASTSFKLQAKIGEGDSSQLCNPDEKQDIKVESVQMVEALIPSGSQKLSSVGNLYVKLTLPDDQTVANTIEAARDNFKLAVKLTFTPSNGGASFEKIEDNLVPLEYANKNVKITTDDIPLVVGETYTVIVSTKIYTSALVQDDPKSRNNREGEQDDQTEEQEYSGEVVKIEVEDREFLELSDKKEYQLTVSEGFELTDNDLILYPAKNMSNVYTEDYGGLGFLKLDPAVVSNFQAACVGCILNFGLYENERLRGSKTTVTDLNGFSFPIASLQPDNVYEVRLWVEQAGERKEAYTGHYFKTDQYFTSFESKIAAVNTDNEVSFSSDLNFKIQGKPTNSNDSFFSAEELEQSLTMSIASNPWFTRLNQEYQKLTGNPLTFDITAPQHLSYQQPKIGFLENGNYRLNSTRYANPNPTWVYEPFSPVIFDFFRYAASYNKQLVTNCAYLDTPIPSTFAGGIPCFESGTYCIDLAYNINNLTYYQNGLSLPAIYAPVQQQICFENDRIRDFNSLYEIKKTVAIKCIPNMYDSKLIKYEISISAADGSPLLFPENFKIINSNPQLTVENTADAAEVFDFVSTNSPALFTSSVASRNGCPIDADAFAIIDGTDTEAFTYEIDYTKEAVEEVVPCLTIKKIPIESNYTINLNNWYPDITSTLFSSESDFLIESWETEEDKGILPQKIKGDPIDIIILNGLNEELRTITEADGNSLKVSFTPSILNDISLKITADSKYTCGTYTDSPPQNDFFKTKNYVGYAKNKTDACQANNAGEFYFGSAGVDEIVGTSVFYSSISQAPFLVTDKGYYKTGDDEVFVIDENGTLLSKETCNKYYVEFACDYRTDNVTATIYKDVEKTPLAATDQFSLNSLSVNFSNTNGFLNLKNLNYYSGIVKMGDERIKCSNLPVVSVESQDFTFGNQPTMNCNPLPAAPSLNAPAEANLGESIIISASGCSSGKYLWRGKTAFDGNRLTEVLTNDIIYSVQCVDGSCLSAATEVKVRLRQLEITTDDQTAYVCGNRAKKLTVRGCGATILWSTASSATIDNVNGTVVNVGGLSGLTTFNVTCSFTAGSEVYEKATSIELNTYEVPIKPTVTSNIPATQNNTVCLNEEIILTATACQTTGSNLLWSNGKTDLIITEYMAANKSYSAICKSAYCSSEASNTVSVTVNIPPKPTIEVSNARNSYVCSGQAPTLTASGCQNDEGTVWYKNISGSMVEIDQGKTIKPVLNKGSGNPHIYAVKCRENIGNAGVDKWCYGAESVNITINEVSFDDVPALSVKLTISNAEICAYQSSTITASGCTLGDIEWFNNVSTSWDRKTLNSLSTSTAGEYKVRCNLNDNCFSYASVLLTVRPEPSVAVINDINNSENKICEGTAISLIGSCQTGESIEWQWADGNNVTPFANRTPTTSETYYAICKQTYSGVTCETQSANRSSKQLNDIPKPPKPAISASFNRTNTANQANICQGELTNISATACTGGTLIWKVGDGEETSTPTLTGIGSASTYQVKCEVWECDSDWSDVFRLDVRPNPTAPNISKSFTGDFYCGNSVTLTASSDSSYERYNWSNGGTGQNTEVNNTGTYTVKSVTTYGCDSPAASVSVDIRPVPSTPTVYSSAGWNICDDRASNISASACTGGTLFWKVNDAQTANPTLTNVSTTTSYQVKCEIADCGSDWSNKQTLIVNPTPGKPTITKSSTRDFECGGSLTLTSSSGDKYVWSNGTAGQSITVSSSGNYSVSLMSNAGCESLAESVSVDIRPVPATPTVYSSAGWNICDDRASNISANACTGGTLFWKVNDAQTANPTLTNVSTTTSYQVKCEIADCGSDWSNKQTLIVNPTPGKPTITKSSTRDFECGGSLTLTSSSGDKYVWSNGTAGQSITVSSSGNYSVSLMSNAGCESLAESVSVDIRPVPATPTVYSSAGWNICDDRASNISASACTGGTLFWKVNDAQTANPTLTNVSTTTSYQVRCEINGCSSEWSNKETLIVNPTPGKPSITKSNDNTFQCGGSVTLTSNSGDKYEWSDGTSSQSITVYNGGNYSVAIMSNAGCKSPTESVSVDIRGIPAVPTASDVSVCSGESATISASGCNGTYNWDNSLSAIASHTVTRISGVHTYKVSCTENGCTSAEKVIKVTVNDRPITTVSANPQSICSGAETTISGGCTSGGYISWNNGLMGESTNRKISLTDNYTFVATCNNEGCTSSNSVGVTVYDNPAPPTITGNSSYCAGDPITISASTTTAGASVVWNSYDASPSVGSHNYIAYAAKTYGRIVCSSSVASKTVVINSQPTMSDISVTDNPCNYNLSLTSNCDDFSISWTRLYNNNVENYGQGKSINTKNSGLYTATCSQNGCTISKTKTVSSNHTSNSTPIWEDTDVTSCGDGKCYKEQRNINPCVNVANQTIETNDCNITPNWVADGAESCTSSNGVRTCLQPQKDTNPCSVTSNDTREVFVQRCTENLELGLNIDGAIVVQNADQSGCTAFFWTINGLPATALNNEISPTRSGTYAVSCSNSCGSTSSGSYDHTMGNR